MKTVKSYLKMCLQISNTDMDSLKGIRSLTKKEIFSLGYIRAEVQNELGENPELLSKFNLEYKG